MRLLELVEAQSQQSQAPRFRPLAVVAVAVGWTRLLGLCLE